MVDHSGQKFDFIVVGAGSAGSVVANRLSANPKQKVLVLEAGPASHFWSRFPIGYAKLVENPAVNWMYSGEPEESTNGRRLYVPRGKMLGGSSSINGLVFVRGQARDYNTWAQLGNRGWSYEDVLPHFKNIESYEGDGDGDDTLRGRNGPLRVTDPDETGPLYEAIIKAAGENGIPHNRDYNGTSQHGISMSQATIAGGRRMSTAHCFLDPVKSRPNLTIQTDALSEGLILEGKRCIGVRYTVNGQPREARAAREVVICAGTINSPQLLELSGIGQADRLKDLGITVQHDLPGVGENLRDHYAPRTRWKIAAPGVTYNDKLKGLGMVWQALRYVFTKKGMMGIPAAPIRAFVKSREGLEDPDILLGWVPLLYDPGYKLSKTPGVTCYAHAMRPESTGTIHLTSADPRAAPAINFNFLSNPLDIEVSIASIRIARAIMTASAMKDLMVSEILPGSNLTTDDEILRWIKEYGETTYHPVGTCKMGSDPMAVVDNELRVHGIDGLRVADASIMPTQISGNTNAPSIMIGEKVSSMVLASAA